MRVTEAEALSLAAALESIARLANALNTFFDAAALWLLVTAIVWPGILIALAVIARRLKP